jgi:hypothetical protein
VTNPRIAWESVTSTGRDILTLRRVPAENEDDDDRVTTIINGRDLIPILREMELPFATADGKPMAAGSYGGLTPVEWEWIGDMIEGKPSQSRLADGSVALLACECGETDCWPLCVHIEINSGTVEISGFFQPYRPEWRHDGLGPFVFSRAQVLREVRGLQSEDSPRDME